MQPSLNGKHTAGPTVASITTSTKKLPSRIAVHALQKWGKTSFAAQAPKPIFLMTRGEDGLLTLMDSGQLPPTPHFPDCAATWNDVKIALTELIVQQHDYKTLVIDTLNGVERLINEDIVAKKCDNDWEKFDAYGRGPKLAVAQVVELTKLLDRIREKGIAIACLIHSQVKPFRNPEGTDYDRWEPVLAKETWALLDRWFDMILFGNFEVMTKQKGKNDTKGKAISQTRLLMTQRHAAYDAGNRHGLPEEIDCGSSAAEAWANFISALKTPNKQGA